MVWHNHLGNPLMVPGAPSPADLTDDMMLIEDGANFNRRMLCYPRVAWVPLLAMLQQMREERGKLPTDRTS